MVKNPPAMQEAWVWSLGLEDLLEKEMANRSSIFAGEFHGQKSMVGYTVHGVADSNMNEWLNTHTQRLKGNIMSKMFIRMSAT